MKTFKLRKKPIAPTRSKLKRVLSLGDYTNLADFLSTLDSLEHSGNIVDHDHCWDCGGTQGVEYYEYESESSFAKRYKAYQVKLKDFLTWEEANKDEIAAESAARIEREKKKKSTTIDKLQKQIEKTQKELEKLQG